MIREKIKIAVINYYKEFGYDWLIKSYDSLKKESLANISEIISVAQEEAKKKMDLIIKVVNESDSFWDLFNKLPDSERLFDLEGNFNPEPYEALNPYFDITEIFVDPEGLWVEVSANDEGVSN